MDVKLEELEAGHLDGSRNKAILIVTSVFLAISLFTVMLRCFVRTQVVRAWGWDDGTMVIAMVSQPAPSTTRTPSNTSPYIAGFQRSLRPLRNHWM